MASNAKWPRAAASVALLVALTVLQAGCGSRPDSGRESAVIVASAVNGPACTNHNVVVQDLHADFRDIWAGRETAATGKQSDPSGAVAVDFNTTVSASYVNASFVPTDTSGSCGATVPAVAGATVAGSTVWGTLTSDQTRPTTPSPFNLFVRETASGVVSAAGPVAAGGDVTLSSFSVNGTVRQPIGLVAGGRATLANGSVTGDLTYGVASTVPGTVTVTGTKSQLAYDLGAAFKNLESLSTLLTKLTATGTAQLSNGTLQLTGKAAGLNVFQLSADTLRQASTIAVSLPAGAAAIIGVDGISVDLSNKGITMSGATASKLLWNFANASLLHVSSIGLSGSILAPRASFSFDSGSITGTVVARSFLSSGSGTLASAPLAVASVFTQAMPSEVALMAASPLVGGCTYQFQMPNSAGLTAAGACLSASVSVTFMVAAHALTPAARELVSLQLDPSTHTLGRFTARANVNTPVGDALVRYQSAIGISNENLVAVGTPVNSSTRKGQVVAQYQQYAQGYPVAGYGYFVASANGIFRSANGRVAPNLPALPVVPSQTITSATALQKALTYLKITQAPWVKTPAQYTAPVGSLVVVAKKAVPAASDFVLAWTFPFGKATGIGNPADIQVDAVTGAVIAASPGPEHALDEHSTYLGQVDSIVDTLYSGQRHFSAAQYKAPDNSIVNTLSSKAITADGALITSTNVTLGDHDLIGGFPKYPLDPTPATPWTTTEPDEQAMASAEWALELSSAFLGTLALQVAGASWGNIDGIGHQKVFVNYFPNPTSAQPSDAFYDPMNSDPDTARIFLVARPPTQMPVTPDTVSHEFAHALLANLRQASALGTLSQIKESGSISEGLADLFAIAFNHKQLTGISAPWSCLNLQLAGSAGATYCNRNAADPHNTNQPELYLETPYYVDYSSYDPTDCAAPDGTTQNDDCGAHDNSTIISHWGYLLGVGSAALQAVPCNLQVQPLAADPDTAFRVALNVVYLAAGTRTSVGSKDLPQSGTFAQFRDATMQVAEEMAAEGTLSADAVKQIALAWTAVGLPPAGVPTTAQPANNLAQAVYPWADFTWPIAGQDGQTGGSWDFQIGDGDLVNNIVYQQSSITDTVVQNGQTMGSLPLALPSDSPDTYLWRVRPHSDMPWESCTPVYSFTGTTEPDPVRHLAIVDDVDSKKKFLPGPLTLTWDVVQGTASPNYDVRIGTSDPQCQSAAGVTDLPETGLAGDGTTETDATDFVLQPGTTYVVDVQPVGPNDFDGKPSLGDCFPLTVKTGDLPRPIQSPTGPFVGLTTFNVPWGVDDFAWQTFGAPVKSIVTRYDRDAMGNCGTTPVGEPAEVTLSGTQSTGLGLLEKFPDSDKLPNPTGYCWDVVDVAANGNKSAPMTPKGQFTFLIPPIPGLSPGYLLNNTDNAPWRLPGGLDTYGISPVTFTWQDASQVEMATPDSYGLKIGRWPWVPVSSSTPGPANCNNPENCALGPVVASTLFYTTVPGASQYGASGDVASKGRYCWQVWPIYNDPANPGMVWSRQPLVDLQPPLCYTSGPAPPSISCDNTLPPFFKPDPVTCEISFPYVPDSQYQIVVDGTNDGDVVIDEGCQPDPATTQLYQDIYDCHAKITINNVQPKHDYAVHALTYNDNAYPPVMDNLSLAKVQDYPFTTGECGENQDPCCEDPNCKVGDPSCDHYVCNSPDLGCSNFDGCEPCGARGHICCARSTCNDPAKQGCDMTNICSDCGGLNKPCCEQNGCKDSGTVCAPDPQHQWSKTGLACQQCGVAGGPCCGLTPDQIAAGSNGGTCDTANGYICRQATCVACGHPGQPCCEPLNGYGYCGSGAPEGAICRDTAGRPAASGTCVSCGHVGERCCPGSISSDNPFYCGGGHVCSGGVCQDQVTPPCPGPVVPAVPHCDDVFNLNLTQVPGATQYNVQYMVGGQTYSTSFSASQLDVDFNEDSACQPISTPVWYSLPALGALGSGQSVSYRVQSVSSCTSDWSAWETVENSDACRPTGYCAEQICAYCAPPNP
jgi:choice-of-anchor A domain-containing protein